MTDSNITNKIPKLFSELGLNNDILKAVIATGYTQPSPIQQETIPHILAGTDVLGQAQTGTGKTAAFALPTLQKIDSNSSDTQVLVLAPTRELAIQVSEAYKTYAKHLSKVSILPIYGGADYTGQLRGLKKGAHIVVGTPGRIMDHIEKGTLKLGKINTLVLDEADEMLRMGFIDDVEWILKKCPKKKQVTLFSATMPQQIKKITEKYLVDEVVVKIKSKTDTATTIQQYYLGINQKQKSIALRQILEIENRDASIIFVNTKAATEELAIMLNRHGYKVAALNGDLQQKQRERVIDQIKSGQIDIILATDIAARGLDVERISHVINYDLPRDSESYVHRIGRTGRAGRSGTAIMLVTPRERRLLNTVERDIKTKITPYPIPTIEEINSQRISQFKTTILEISAKKDLELLKNIVTDIHKDDNVELTTIAAAIAALYLEKTPLLLGKREQLDIIDLAQAVGKRDNSSNSSNSNGGRTRRKSTRSNPSDMDCYRINMGKGDNVKPSHIVGAIANEGGIDGTNIGAINIYENHTEIFLPKNITKQALNKLKKTRIIGKPMNIEVTSASKEEPKENNKFSKRRRPSKK